MRQCPHREDRDGGAPAPGGDPHEDLESGGDALSDHGRQRAPRRVPGRRGPSPARRRAAAPPDRGGTPKCRAGHPGRRRERDDRGPRTGSRGPASRTRDRLAALETRGGSGPVQADAGTITTKLARLDDLLRRDVPRANAFFRAHVAPISCAPVKEEGRRFYRATVAANGPEIIKKPGVGPGF